MPAINPCNQPEVLSRQFILNAISKDDLLTIENISDRSVCVWDSEDAKIITFQFPDRINPQLLAQQIHISSAIPEKYQVDPTALANYLWTACDKNAFTTLDQLVVIWSEPDDPILLEPADFVDPELTRLCSEFGDEYALELGCDLLGQLWFERNIVIINMGQIVRTAEEISMENRDIPDPYFTMENQTLTGFLTTAIHELRHLQMDTNILLPEDMYPVSLASEERVEAYCRDAFEASTIPLDIFPSLFREEPSLEERLQAALSVSFVAFARQSEKAGIDL